MLQCFLNCCRHLEQSLFRWQRWSLVHLLFSYVYSDNYLCKSKKISLIDEISTPLIYLSPPSILPHSIITLPSSSPPTKLPLLPPSSPWRGCSRTPFGRRSRHSIVVGTPIVLVLFLACSFIRKFKCEIIQNQVIRVVVSFHVIGNFCRR